MSIDNLTELKTELDNWSKRTLGSQVDQFISLAEKRIVRAFAKNGLQDKLKVRKTLSASSNELQIPVTARGIDTIYINSNPKRVLNYMPADAFYRRWLSSNTAPPKAYTLEGRIAYLGPSPDDSTYSYICIFRQDLDLARKLDQYMVPFQSHSDYDNSPTTEGTFSGGTGHAVGDVLTMSNGSLIEVTSVSGGVVDGFFVQEAGASVISSGDSVTQSSTTGSGASFSMAPEADNLANLVLINHPDLYLYGALAEAFGYYRNSAEQQRYLGLFKDCVAELKSEAFNLGGPLQIYNPQASAGAPARSR